MNLIKKCKEMLAKALEILLIVAVGALVLDVVWGVFTRYVMGEQAKWTEELAKFLLIWVSLLGGAVAFGEKGHLGVDYFVNKFDGEARKLMSAVAHVIVLFFASSIFLYGGYYIVNEAFTLEQMTPALGWKMGYVYLVVPIAGFFIVLFTIENLYETITAPITEEEKTGGEKVS